MGASLGLRTGPDGEFRLEGLPTGMIRLEASAPDKLATLSAPFEIRAGEETLGVEIVLDLEVQQAICNRYGLLSDGVGPDDPFFELKRHMSVQRFLGYDYVFCRIDDMRVATERATTTDTAALQRQGGRAFVDEHEGRLPTRSPHPE